MVDKSIPIHEDNQSCINAAKGNCNLTNRRMKHIDIKLHLIKEAISLGFSGLVYTMTSNMLADFLTKSTLSLESLKTALVYFIADCDLPLSITDSKSFQQLLELCNPSVPNILVLFTALTGHLSNLVYFHQEHIYKIITKAGTFVSFTANLWTSPNVKAFMAVTANFMDCDFKLNSILLGSNKIEGNVHVLINS
ncbi:hypothetical protein O181_000033 [Austropuccinia psidii MF-1]|uniref:Uncharacterized protein n=1 Tax=Austropuccinia psidii MF-1 TaxID=1389203 RepID=A0A9Q3B815_9BASI|nr:hypothetical protein [Austropuccinia psidii MF-1]